MPDGGHKPLRLEGTEVVVAAGFDRSKGKDGTYRTWTRGPQTGHDNGQMLSLLGLIAANIVIATARHFKKPYQELIDQAVTMFRRSLEEYVHEIAKGEHEHDGMIYDGRPGSTN